MKKLSTVKGYLPVAFARPRRPFTFDSGDLNSDHRHPLRPDLRHDVDAHSPYAVWGWIAGGMLLVLTLVGALDISYEPIQSPCGSLCAMNGPR